MRSSSVQETSPGSSETAQSSRLSSRRRRAETRWGGTGTALAAILGVPPRCVSSASSTASVRNLLTPTRVDCPARVEARARRRRRSALVRLPEAADVCQRPVSGYGTTSRRSSRRASSLSSLARCDRRGLVGRPRAYGTTSAGLVAAVRWPSARSRSRSREAVTDVPLTLGVVGRARVDCAERIQLAGVAVGLATGFKYPGVFFFVPLVVAGWKQSTRLACRSRSSWRAFLRVEPVHRRPPPQAWHEADTCSSSRGTAGRLRARSRLAGRIRRAALGRARARVIICGSVSSPPL